MENFFLILVGAALTENIVIAHTIGADLALVSSQRHDITRGLSCIMLVLLPLLTVISSAMTQFVLFPLQLQHLQLFVFIMLIIITVYGLKVWPKPFCKSGAEMFLPLAGMNVTVLGTLLLNQQHDHHLFSSLIFGLGTAIGFVLMLSLLTAINLRLAMIDLPEPFKGVPITLITLGLISMAFLGFTGLVK